MFRFNNAYVCSGVVSQTAMICMGNFSDRRLVACGGSGSIVASKDVEVFTVPPVHDGSTTTALLLGDCGKTVIDTSRRCRHPSGRPSAGSGPPCRRGTFVSHAVIFSVQR